MNPRRDDRRELWFDRPGLFPGSQWSMPLYQGQVLSLQFKKDANLLRDRQRGLSAVPDSLALDGFPRNGELLLRLMINIRDAHKLPRGVPELDAPSRGRVSRGIRRRRPVHLADDWRWMSRQERENWIQRRHERTR